MVLFINKNIKIINMYKYEKNTKFAYCLKCNKLAKATYIRVYYDWKKIGYYCNECKIFVLNENIKILN